MYQTHREFTLTKLRQIRAELHARIGQHSRTGFVMPQDVIDYESWNEDFETAAHVELPFLQRFSEADERATLLCRALATQIDPGLPLVLVAGLLPDYCACYPDSFVIAVPTVQYGSLLGWPDLAHELAHIRYSSDRDELLGDFIGSVVDAQYPGAPVADSVSGPRNAEEELGLLWRGDWVEELACDVLAAYELGPAFGWQHLRRTVGRSAGAFTPTLHEAAGSTHPADAARKQAIVLTLEAMSAGSQVGELTQAWESYVRDRSVRAPADDTRTYPDALLRGLVARVLRAAPGLGIRAYTESPVQNPDLRALIDEAWRRMRKDPASYTAWERATLHALELPPVPDRPQLGGR